VVLHSDLGMRFTSGEDQAFVADHGLICSMTALDHGADNATAEGFFGMR